MLPPSGRLLRVMRSMRSRRLLGRWRDPALPVRPDRPAGLVPPAADVYRSVVQSSPSHPGALRRGTLAASVLHDIPLEPRENGVVVGRHWDERDAWTSVSWS